MAVRSPSHHEGPIADHVEALLREVPGARVHRVKDNVVAFAGEGPRVVLCSHLDTVPATDLWTRDPWDPVLEGGRIYGLGSNDAKASVAAMIEAFRQVAEDGGPCEVALTLVAEEETGGDGAEVAAPWLREQGFEAEAAVLGEPTGLDVAVAQKGLMVCALVAEGDACHSAHARAKGARNAARALARDMVRLETHLDLAPDDPYLGPTTVEPTLLSGGTAKNMVPSRAEVVLDCRTVPTLPHDQLAARLRAAVRETTLEVRSDRLRPVACPEDAALLEAVRRARPEAALLGSPTMSDMVWFGDRPAVKVGPGQTRRSHTPDEFVLVDELEAGARFYRDLLTSFAEVTKGRP